MKKALDHVSGEYINNTVNKQTGSEYMMLC